MGELEVTDDTQRLVCKTGGVLYLGADSDRLTHSDVVLCAADGRVRTHRAILAASCDLLRSCLRRPTPEEDSTVVLPDFNVAEVELMLDVIYGKVEEAPLDEVRELGRTVKFRWLERDPALNGDLKVKVEKCEDDEQQQQEGQTMIEVSDEEEEPLKSRKRKRKHRGDSMLKPEIVLKVKSEDSSREDFDYSFYGNDDAYYDDDEDYKREYDDDENGDEDEEDDEEFNDDWWADNDFDPDFEPVKKRRGRRPKNEIRREEFTLTECPRCGEKIDEESKMLEHLNAKHLFPALRHSQTHPERLSCPEEDCSYAHPKVEVVMAHLKWRHEKVFCIYCNSYVESHSFKSHMTSNHKKLPRAFCPLSGKVFACSADIAEHHERTGTQAEFFRLEEDPDRPGFERCPEPDCQHHEDNDRLALFRHLSETHGNFGTCPYCASQFTRFDALKQHVFNCHNSDVGACRKCRILFADREEQKIHRRATHGAGGGPGGGASSANNPADGSNSKGSEDAICHLCGATVKALSMKSHVKLCKTGRGRGRRLYPEPPLHPTLRNLAKNAQGKFSCPHEGCTHANGMRSRLIKHFNVEHNRQQCTYCNKEVAFYQLEEHIAFQHTGKTDRVQCPECPQKFFNRTYLRRHVEAVHVAQKNWICSVCGEGFITRRDEVQHRHEKHTRNRRWPCPICGKIFRSSTLIQPHVDVAHPGIVVPPEMIKKAE